MKRLLCLALFGLTTLTSPAIGRSWTNTLGGDWFVAANWSPNGVPGSSDTANITTAGTYTVFVATGTVATASITIGGSSGTQTLIYGTPTGGQLPLTNSVVQANGVLSVTNGGLRGSLLVQSGGTLQFDSTGLQLYSLDMTNEGTVVWNNGSLSVGGNNSETTRITNSGLWLITGNATMGYGGGSRPLFLNSGTLRKLTGTGSSGLSGIDLINYPTGLVDVQTGTLQLSAFQTNVLGGTFNTVTPAIITIFNGTSVDSGGIVTGNGTFQFSNGTLILRTNTLSGLRLVGGDVYLSATTFQQAGAITNLTLDGSTLHGTNRVAGTLTLNSGGLIDVLTVQPGGQLVCATTGSKLLYGLTLLNQGDVAWSAGSLSVGGNPGTVISNGSVWTMTGDVSMNNGGGNRPAFYNYGTLRKMTTAGASSLSGVDLINFPTGLVDVQTGTLQLSATQTNILGGTFNVLSPATITIFGGTSVDSAGVVTGNGTFQFTSGTLILRTNTLVGLKLAGGDVYLSATTFQQTGAITNLTLDGSTLRGTNRLAGTLTFNSGGLIDVLTVQPGGQLLLATSGSKLLYGATLLNQGDVIWSGGGLAVGGTPGTIVSNGGAWTMTSDGSISYGGGQTPVFTNLGTIRKSAGSGTSQLTGPALFNQASGIIQVDTGTIQLPSGYTNSAGTLRLNGGTLAAAGNLITMTGGTLDGTGTVTANTIVQGGTFSPGQSPGSIQFSFANITLGSNATFVVEGTGIVPGTQYDQILIGGTAAISNCTLQVTSLPTVSVGTVFAIVTNTSGTAVTGTFNGLPESSVIIVSGQPFRIHYNLAGKNVVLVRDSGAASALLSNNVYSNGNFRFSGAGGSAIIYGVQATTNFLQWTNIGFTTGDLSGNFIFNDTNAFRYLYRFYRATN